MCETEGAVELKSKSTDKTGKSILQNADKEEIMCVRQTWKDRHTATDVYLATVKKASACPKY